jgi:peptidoglycan/xylan/chitin deacetylase (PgdA/CDA1 family)
MVRFPVRFFKVLTWPFIQMGRLRWRGILELVLLAGLLICGFFIWKLIGDIHSLRDRLVDDGMLPVPADTIQVSPPKLFEPAEGGMVYSSELTIRGEAEDDRIIALSINGKLDRVMLPEKGRFVFEKAKLSRGRNRLEVRALTQDGQVSSLQTVLVTFASPTLSYLSRDFRRGSLDERQVALTFDGGAGNNAAEEILNFLKDKEIQCTFFLTGRFIRNFPETVKQIAADGHEVGNHTWSHPHMTSYARDREQRTLPAITHERIRDEFNKTASLFRMVTGEEMARLWRAPYGEYNREILTWAGMEGYKHVGWTVGRGWEENMDTMDWVADRESKAYHTADEVAEKILAYANRRGAGANGVIILMHLGTEREDDFPHRKLPEIIDGLHSKGYRFVKVSQMLPEG